MKALNLFKIAAGRARRGGFTLLEVLIAILIITTGIVAIAKSFNKGTQMYADIEYVDLALNIAQARMEELKDFAFEDLADAAPAPDGDFPGFIVAVNIINRSGDLKQVDVSVSPGGLAGPADITLTTLAAE